MRKVLITGITGYIGSNLARYLLPDHEIYGLVRSPLREEYIADIKDRIHLLYYDGSYESVEYAVKESCPDLVYHLAAYYTGRHGAKDTPTLIQSNIVFGGYLLEAMAACGSSEIIWASTVMAHFQGDEFRPQNLYAATKNAFESLLAYYADAELLKSGTLVLSDTYGPGDNRAKILNIIKRTVKTNEQLSLSDGGQEYDLVYIDDVISAFVMAGQQLMANEWKNKTFQVCSAAPLSLRETVELMLEINDLSLNAGWGQRPAAERDMRKAIRLYPTLPGWTPKVALEEGLKLFCTAETEMT